jgi:2'-5' RNA ligase
MRLFTGLSLPYEVRRNLELLIEHLKPLAPLNWSPAGNLHITTKFIGEWPEGRIMDLREALRGIPRYGAFEIAFRGIGWYPNPHHPKVLFAGVAAESGLAQLADLTEDACVRIGIPQDTRAYSPHLTLARIKDPRLPQLLAVKQAIAELPAADFGLMKAAKFNLYESKLQPGGSVYSVIEEYPL